MIVFLFLVLNKNLKSVLAEYSLLATQSDKYEKIRNQLIEKSKKLCRLAGIHLPDNAGEDSVSLLSVLKGAPSGIRDTLVSHSFYGRFAFRQGAWKLQFSPGSGGWSRPRDANGAKNGLSPIQLYDLKTDPSEKNNLLYHYFIIIVFGINFC